MSVSAWRLDCSRLALRASMGGCLRVAVAVRVASMRVVVSGVSFFGILNRVVLLAVTVSSMAVASMTVAVIVEQHQSHQVRRETQASDYQYELWVGDNLRLHKALNGVEEDGDTQCDEEDAIDERSQRLGALVAIGVHFRGGTLVCHFDGPETDAEGQDIVEHVEGIGDEGERVHGISGDEFEDEEARINHQQDDDPAGFGEGHGWVSEGVPGGVEMRWGFASGLAAAISYGEVQMRWLSSRRGGGCGRGGDFTFSCLPIMVSRTSMFPWNVAAPNLSSRRHLFPAEVAFFRHFGPVALIHQKVVAHRRLSRHRC